MVRTEPGTAALDAGLSSTPGEAYASQRTKGFRLLRFSPRLEAEYRAQMRAEQRGSTLICTATALVIWLVFMSLDAVRLGLPGEISARNADIFAIIGLRMTTLAVLTLLLFCLVNNRLPITYPRLSFLSLVMIGMTTCISVNIYKVRGLPQAELAEFAIIMAVFLPVGLTFRQSLAAASLINVNAVLAGYAMLGASELPAHARLSAMLLFASLVGAVGAYLREHAQRDSFLLSRLMRYFAMHDPLTGIGNRRHFEDRATAALKQARRDGAPVTLAILDIDHFKSFNDRYGHHAGDLALRQLARRVALCLRRPLDITGRLGGEEFGILLYDAGPPEAFAIIETITASIADLAIEHDASPTRGHLTVSVGAAQFDGVESLETLYRRADLVLYRCKAAGRNRAMIDTAGPSIAGCTAREPDQFQQA
ncbi:MAG: hypothetical protein DCF30_15815 [Hyphomicrobiales bacterium]|nr:MAG: hypothetical protein DCF30_15815 [Hyphomicrobiales bacterium]